MHMISVEFNIFLRMQQQDSDRQQQQFVQPPYPQLQLSFKDKAQYQCLTLIIASYGASSLFAHSLIDGQQPANRLNFSRAKQQSLADLYQAKDCLFLIFNDHIEPMKEIYFSKFVTANISFQRAVILSAISRSTLKQATNTPLFHVSTSHFADKLPFPQFQEGIMGLPADLLQWGEIKKAPVACLVGVVGQYELSSEIVQAVFGGARACLPFDGKGDISSLVKRYNMKKYSNKIYL